MFTGMQAITTASELQVFIFLFFLLKPHSSGTGQMTGAFAKQWSNASAGPRADASDAPAEGSP